MDLNVARICEVSTLTIALDSCCTVATHSVCRKEVCVAITTSSDNNCVCRETLELTGNGVLGDDTTSTTVNDNYVFHLVTSIEEHTACVNLL